MGNNNKSYWNKGTTEYRSYNNKMHRLRTELGFVKIDRKSKIVIWYYNVKDKFKLKNNIPNFFIIYFIFIYVVWAIYSLYKILTEFLIYTLFKIFTLGHFFYLCILIY